MASVVSGSVGIAQKHSTRSADGGTPVLDPRTESQIKKRLARELYEMTMREYSGPPPTLGGSQAHDVAMAAAPVMRAAEARMAIECLQRAEEWAAGVDNDIVADMVVIHERLLRWIANSR